MVSFEADAGSVPLETEGGGRDLPSGFVLDEFEIQEVLGRGAFGVTYLARSRADGGQVALKVFQPAASVLTPLDSKDDPMKAVLASFRGEAAMLGRIRHPNIARLRDFRDDIEKPYIVLELEQGLNLEAALDGAHRNIGEAQVRTVIGPLLLAVDSLHDQRILHRDIKPANICLREDGTPVLLDLGASVAVSEPKTEALAVSLLTPGFAAPEQYADSAPEGPWTDIYALAAVAYWMFTGKTPSEATARPKGRVTHKPAVEVARGRASPAFLEAIDRGLELKPERRPHNVREFSEALMAEDDTRTVVQAQDRSKRTGPAAATSSVAPSMAPRPVPAERELQAVPAAPDRAQPPRAPSEPPAFHSRVVDDIQPTRRIKRRVGVPDIQPDQVRRDRAGMEMPPPRRRGFPAGLFFGTLLIMLAGGAGAGYWYWQQQANKTEWSVDPAGNGDTLTISEALLKAKAGSTIRIEPGIYPESLVLTQPVILEASSPEPGATVVEPETGPCLTASAVSGGVKGLTFRKGPGTGGGACLQMVGTGVVISDSTIEADGAPAVFMRDGGNPVLQNLGIASQGNVPAVVIANGTKGRMTDSRIGGPAAFGLLVRGGAAPEVIGNEIQGSTRVGIMIERGASGRFEGNTILGSRGNGVEVRGGARPVFAKNRIEDSGGSGLFIYDGARGEFDSNIVIKSELTGIVLADAAAPTLLNNEIRENGGHGIIFLESSGGNVDGNRVEGNTGFGLAISNDADPALGNNDLSDNKMGDTKKGEVKDG